MGPEAPRDPDDGERSLGPTLVNKGDAEAVDATTGDAARRGLTTKARDPNTGINHQDLTTVDCSKFSVSTRIVQ